MDQMREGGLMVAEGGGGRRKTSFRTRENNRRRERRRRAITMKIFYGLRAHGNYDLRKHCDNNEVLKALCKEAGWVVLPDGTTFRKGSWPSLPTIKTGTGGTSTTTPCSSQRPSPIPSYQCSPTSSSFPSPSTLDMNNTIPFSLTALRISNSAPVTPPVSSPASKFPKPNDFNSSLKLPFFVSSAPTSPTRHQRFIPATLPECDESDCYTIEACQWLRFENDEPMVTYPNSPTFNLVKPMAATKDTGSDKGMEIELEFEDGGVQAWEGERINDHGIDDLELTLGGGIAKM